MCVRERERNLDWFLRLWTSSAEDLEEDESKSGNGSSAVSPRFLYLSICWPIQGRVFSGCVCVFLPWTSTSLSTHLSFIYNEVSGHAVPVVAQIRCFWHAVCHTHVHVSACPSPPLFPIYTSFYLSVRCPACHLFCQINRSSTYQFVLLTGFPSCRSVSLPISPLILSPLVSLSN